ncbi:hypothetical protein [Streptomyces sp. NPDC048142]|uniref:hypothetical protein n=1 Tax=Streptomyces sp. NPDC048142 TaxID=3365501 RepID=UPI00371E0ADF
MHSRVTYGPSPMPRRAAGQSINFGRTSLDRENATCPMVTFAEQVPSLTVCQQRRRAPPLLAHLVEAVGVVPAGRGGPVRTSARSTRPEAARRAEHPSP